MSMSGRDTEPDTCSLNIDVQLMFSRLQLVQPISCSVNLFLDLKPCL